MLRNKVIAIIGSGLLAGALAVPGAALAGETDIRADLTTGAEADDDQGIAEVRFDATEVDVHQDDRGRQRLLVMVENAALADETVEVMVRDSSFEITLDEDGKGKLALDSQDDDEVSTLAEGDTVDILLDGAGIFSGILEDPNADDEDDADADNQGQGNADDDADADAKEDADVDDDDDADNQGNADDAEEDADAE
jgi:hypothetical protein